jgi:hypothetical protein
MTRGRERHLSATSGQSAFDQAVFVLAGVEADFPGVLHERVTEQPVDGLPAAGAASCSWARSGGIENRVGRCQGMVEKDFSCDSRILGGHFGPSGH